MCSNEIKRQNGHPLLSEVLSEIIKNVFAVEIFVRIRSIMVIINFPDYYRKRFFI